MRLICVEELFFPQSNGQEVDPQITVSSPFFLSFFLSFFCLSPSLSVCLSVCLSGFFWESVDNLVRNRRAAPERNQIRNDFDVGGVIVDMLARLSLG